MVEVLMRVWFEEENKTPRDAGPNLREAAREAACAVRALMMDDQTVDERIEASHRIPSDLETLLPFCGGADWQTIRDYLDWLKWNSQDVNNSDIPF